MAGRSTFRERVILREIEKQYGVHLFRIATPIPTLKLNTYFVADPEPTLIDVPPDSPRFIDELQGQLRAVSSSVETIKTIIITHPHFDHYGCAASIARKGSTRVWIMKGSGAWLENYKQECREEEQFSIDFLTRAGAPADLIDYSVRFFHYLSGFASGIKPSRYLHEGEEIRLGSLHCTVETVPGHTPWCMLLSDSHERIAFTGDFLIKEISSNPVVQRPWAAPQGYKSLKAYISSLKKVRDMDLRFALPGHGEIIENPSQRCEDLLDFIQERREFILRQLEAAAGSQTPYQTVQGLFPKLSKDQLFLAVSEVTAHLEVLEEEGYVRRRTEFPLSFYLA